MTTLPQTTGTRFPRVGVRGPSIPGTLGPASAAAIAAPTGPSLTLGDVVRILRTNLPLIGSFLLVALIAGYCLNQYVFMRYYQEYTAEGLLQVQSPNFYDPLNGNGGGSYADRTTLEIRQKTIAQKLGNPNLWQPLFENDQSLLRQSKWVDSFRTPQNTFDQAAAAQAINKGLHVSPEPASELITASLSAPTAEDAQQVLSAITDRLIQDEQSRVASTSENERAALAGLQARYDTQVNNLTKTVNDITGRLNTPRNQAGGGGGLMIVKQMELSRLVQDRSDKQKELDEANALATAYTAELNAGGTPELLARQMSNDPSIQRLEANLDQAELAKRSILAQGQFSPESRQFKAAEADYNVVKEQLDKKREELRVSRGDALRTSLVSSAANLKADVERIGSQIAAVEQSLGELTADTGKLNTALDLQKYYTDKRSRVEERLQILEANKAQETKRAGTVALVYPIKQPEQISFPRLRNTLGAAAVLGLALSLGIAFLREVMDTTVRSPRDITKVGHLNLLGMIPHSDDDPQAAAGELGLTISQTPHSIISENFRQVRTRLQHAASLDTTRSLLVTSPGPGDGKTTVACNLAAGLALNGRKILLVDANFRRPALHAVFGVENARGFGDVLTGQAPLADVVHQTGVPNLSVLTTGPRPANPTELLESQLLTDLIDHALEDYDHVIFDAGPILLVSETVALAPRVDGVVSVVRAKANSRGLLTRMRDTLRGLKAEHLGVVLNGVRHHTGGYYARNTRNYYAYSNDQAE